MLGYNKANTSLRAGTHNFLRKSVEVHMKLPVMTASCMLDVQRLRLQGCAIRGSKETTPEKGFKWRLSFHALNQMKLSSELEANVWGLFLTAMSISIFHIYQCNRAMGSEMTQTDSCCTYCHACQYSPVSEHAHLTPNPATRKTFGEQEIYPMLLGIWFLPH